MHEFEDQLRRAAPEPTGQLDTAAVGRRAGVLQRRRSVRRVVGAGTAAAVLLGAGVLWVVDLDRNQVDVAVEPDPAESVEVSLVTVTYVAEGSYRCERDEPFRSVTNTGVTQTWSDPENARWATREESDVGTGEQLALGNPVYPTQEFSRGGIPEQPRACGDGHPASQVVGMVMHTGFSRSGQLPAVMTADQERALEGVLVTFRDLGVESGAGVDSLGRAAVIWESRQPNGYRQWDDEQLQTTQHEQWFVDPDTGQVLEVVQHYSYGDYGEAHGTITYSDISTVTVDAEKFDPSQYPEENEFLIGFRDPSYAAVPSTDDIRIGVDGLWPAEPVAGEPVDVVEEFVAEVLDATDVTIESELDGLSGRFEVVVGELEMRVHTFDEPGGPRISSVQPERPSGSGELDAFVAPGAVLSVRVRPVAPNYTIVIANADGSSTWTADGIAVVDDDRARAAITIPGMVFVDAQRILAIGRDHDGTLRHVASYRNLGF